MKPSYTLIYNSTHSRDLDEVGFLRILYTCQKRNEEKSLKSLLVYYGGKFIQCLQGEQHDVETTYKSIRKDNRHNTINTLFKGYIENIAKESLSYRFINGSDDEPPFDFIDLKEDHDILVSVLKELYDAKYLNPSHMKYESYKQQLLTQVRENSLVLQEKYKQ